MRPRALAHFLSATVPALLLNSPAQALVIFGPGHMDIDFNVINDQWELSFSHDDQGDFDIAEPSVLYGDDTIRISMPAAPAFAQTGVSAGDNIWIFPQTQAGSVVWPGLSTERTVTSQLSNWDPPSTLVGSGSYMMLNLLGVSYTGSGTNNQFSLWSTNGFGNPTFYMSTADGLGSNDAYPMLAGGHSHMNWGFSSEGIYDLTFNVSTQLANGNQLTSDPFTLRFGINQVPEPGSLALGGLLTAAGLRRRRR